MTHASVQAQTPARLGDLDADGRPTVVDLQKLLNHLNGINSLPTSLRPYGDINEDGVIDASDRLLLQNAILGLAPLPIPSGALSGTVLDTNGVPANGVAVSLMGSGRITLTDTNGRFTFLAVPRSPTPMTIVATTSTNGQQRVAVARNIAAVPHEVTPLGNLVLRPTTTEARLGDLISQGGWLILGDSFFENFSWSPSPAGPAAADLIVSVGQDGPDRYLEFQGPLISGLGGTVEVEFRYSVSTVSGQSTLASIKQAFTLGATGNGGNVFFGETARSDTFSGPLLAQSSVSFTLESPQEDSFQGDQLFISPILNELFVSMNILLLGDPGGSVTAPRLRQSHAMPGARPALGEAHLRMGKGWAPRPPPPAKTK